MNNAPKNRTSYIMLSVIIVNYNVKYFLEQCLYSVQRAMEGVEGEIIVVDNHSTDGSIAYLQPAFPGVRFIANTENLGFSKANNQGWRSAKGEYILFLNPDTILPEGCLRQSLAVFAQQPRTGALGIHMVDGSGRYLPESKRGTPTPAVSFYKLSGLIRLFPRSRVFAQYYMGHLSANESHTVEVLAGAYMMVRRNILEATGGFDERFFMYGEDVDLSYRIRQQGYDNYYLATSGIIHFKGESTKKDAKYVALFYKAMALFVEKHYGKQAGWYTLLLRAAISARAALSFAVNAFLPSVKQKPVVQAPTLVAGTAEEAGEAATILAKNNYPGPGNILVVAPGQLLPHALATLQHSPEIVFCAGTIPYIDIIVVIGLLPAGTGFLFHAAGSKSIVGSRSKNASGEALV